MTVSIFSGKQGEVALPIWLTQPPHGPASADPRSRLCRPAGSELESRGPRPNKGIYVKNNDVNDNDRVL